MGDIKVAAWNVNGLNNPIKRRLVFDKLRKSKAHIMLLQETHSSPQSSSLWKQEWGGEILFNHGSPSSRGVAILIDRQISFRLLRLISDDDGRFLGADLELGDDTFSFGSIYAPTQDKPNDQIHFLTNTETLLQDLSCVNLILGGDFNCLLEPSLDKNSSSPMPSNSDKARASLNALINNLDVSDTWRIRHPNRKSFTFRRGA